MKKSKINKKGENSKKTVEFKLSAETTKEWKRYCKLFKISESVLVERVLSAWLEQKKEQAIMPVVELKTPLFID